MSKKAAMLDLFFSFLAILSLVQLFDETHQFKWLEQTILVIFAIFVLVELIQSKNKWDYIKSHPFELIALIPLNSVFQGAMLIRLFRLMVIMNVFKKRFPKVIGILQTNGLYKVLMFTIGIIFLAAIPINYFEDQVNSFSEGIWWAIVTTTTVGYGDISPVTPPGRFTAVILMFVGIGSIGMITASVTSYLANNDIEMDEDKRNIKEKVDTLENLTDEEFEILLKLLHNKRIHSK